MKSNPEIVLRDVHDLAAPSIWPLAPGWWAVITALLLVGAVCLARAWRKRRNLQRANALFDDALVKATSPVQRLQIMSELLRRAARRVESDSDTLSGQAWLSFLDEDMPFESFSTEPGSLIESGIYKPDVSMNAVAEIEDLVRARFVSWMTRR